MLPFKVFIAPQVDVPGEVIASAGRQLTRYFDSTIAVMNPRKFSQTTVLVSPHANQVGPKDLLVYITQASLFVTLFDKVYEPDVAHTLAGSPGGGTKKLPNGNVLSEVFWTGGLMNLRPAEKGVALANLMFHEMAHNKHTSDPTALRNGEIPNGDFVHLQCGGGILQSSLTIGLAAHLDINPGNIRAIARVLDSNNPQEACGLFDDAIGF